MRVRIKYKTTIASAVLLCSLFACHPSLYLKGVLKNEAQRGKLYHEILNNDIYRAQLLDSIKNSNKAKLFFSMSMEENLTPIKDKE